MKKCLLISDIDGTLYPLQAESWHSSKIGKRVIDRATRYVAECLNAPLEVGRELYFRFDEDKLEAKYQINKCELLNYAWDLNPSEFVKQDDLSELFNGLNLQTVFLTQAPKIWAERIVKYLNLDSRKVYSAEDVTDKTNEKLLRQFCDCLQVSPLECISLGDQINTDIVPQKSIGMATILIGYKSSLSDYSVNSLEELPNVVESIAHLITR